MKIFDESVAKELQELSQGNVLRKVIRHQTSSALQFRYTSFVIKCNFQKMSSAMIKYASSEGGAYETLCSIFLDNKCLFLLAERKRSHDILKKNSALICSLVYHLFTFCQLLAA